MYCIQNLGHKIGDAVFFVGKQTREGKIEIYERRLKGETIPVLAKSFNIVEFKIKYLIHYYFYNGTINFLQCYLIKNMI